MIHLTEKLAGLETEKNAIISKVEEITQPLQEKIGALEAELEARTKDLCNQGMKIEASIQGIKQDIIDTRDPATGKTLNYPSGTLKFRTTSSIEILDPGGLMYSLRGQLSLDNIANQYVTFKKTPVRKFIDVHRVSRGTVKILEKTSVTFTPKPEAMKSYEELTVFE